MADNAGKAFADASLLGSPSDLLSSYELAASCSEGLYRLEDFLVPTSCFVRKGFLVWGSRFKVGNFLLGYSGLCWCHTQQ